jgi:VCBS repeat-containing protein
MFVTSKQSKSAAIRLPVARAGLSGDRLSGDRLSGDRLPSPRRADLLALEARMLFDGAGALASAELVPVMDAVQNHDPLAAADCRVLNTDEAVVNGAAIMGNPWGDYADSDIDGDSLHVEGIIAGDQTSALPGADLGQTNVGQALGGQYGCITLQADGSYTYTPNANLALTSGQSLTEVFTYSLCDNQGGAARTTLSLTILGAPAGQTPNGTPDNGSLNPGDAGSTSGGTGTNDGTLPVDLSLRDGKPNITALSSDPGQQTGSVLDSGAAGAIGTNSATLSQYLAPLAQVVLIPLSDVRPAALEVTRMDLPRDAFAPFSPERILGVVQESADPIKSAAANAAPIERTVADAAPTKDDCITANKSVAGAEMALAIKPKALRPNLFTRENSGADRNFSEQINRNKQGFKTPAKVRPTAIAKDC